MNGRGVKSKRYEDLGLKNRWKFRHKAVSSSCRGRFHARSSTDYPFTSSCSPRPDRQDAVSFRCLAGSTARKGLAPFGVCAFPSARARVSSPAAHGKVHRYWNLPPPGARQRAAGEDTRAPGEMEATPPSTSSIRLSHPRATVVPPCRQVGTVLGHTLV